MSISYQAVFRNEAISLKIIAYFISWGIYINKDVSFAQLKGYLEYFVKKFLAKIKK